jgi:hypothetical protein
MDSAKQEKYETYKRYDWDNDKDFKTYMDNVTMSTPDRAKMERIRRKWYQKNKDKDFDVEYDPDVNKINEEKKQQESERREQAS